MVTDDEIRLSLPAVPDFARLARLTIAGLANRVGFSYDEVEDLRIAVGEACSMLIGPEGRDGSLDLVYGLHADGLTVEAQGRFLDGVIIDADTALLSEQILLAVVDEFSFEPDLMRVRFRKHRADD
jgi:hypothetical protein